MRLNGRIARLEQTARQHQVGQPCRWHRGIVTFPPSMAKGDAGLDILPPCETPATCPGAGKCQIFLPERKLA